MKRIYYIVACLLSLIAVLPAEAQNGQTSTQSSQQQKKGPRASRGERETTKESGLPELTVRAQDLNERLTQDVGSARWMRVVYRQLDLTKEKNTPLYYPVRPMNGQMNLFSIIFQLLSEGKLNVYEYVDGYEVFDEAHLVNFKELLDRFHVYYEEVANRQGDSPSLVINESDVPSEQVKSYYVKEAWYFDQNNSLFDVKTLAICPLLSLDNDFGQTTSPMFWLPYENIRPYLNTAFIMTSNLNNAVTFTIDDYFRRRMFDGEIIKTQNLLNQPLQAYCPTPDSLKQEQERIENQLVSFEKTLWMNVDSLNVTAEAKSSKKSKTKETQTEKKEEEPKVQKTATVKAPKAKAPKAQKSSSAVRSIRRR